MLKKILFAMLILLALTIEFVDPTPLTKWAEHQIELKEQER